MFALLIPTGSDHDRSRQAVATVGLIVTNTILFCISTFTGLDHVTKQYGFIAADPQWYQWLTHMFLHGSWLHLFGNMMYLWFAGSDLEDVLGVPKFLLVYILGGLASAALFMVTAKAGHFDGLTEPAVGASGAGSALLGLYLVRFPRF